MDEEMQNGLLGSAAASQQSGQDEAQQQMLQGLNDSHDAAEMQYKKLVEAEKLAEVTRKTLERLVKLGEAVTPDDVVEAAGELVSKGASPKNLATMLADMPASSGVGLSGWLAQKSQQFAMLEKQLEAQQGVIRHQLATASMAKLLGHSFGGGEGGTSTAAPPTNALQPQPQPNAPSTEGLQ